MKQLVFADTQGNGLRYPFDVPDSMDTWRLDAFLDFMACSGGEMTAREYLPRPADSLRHESFRRLVCTPSSLLSPPVRFWQNGLEIRDGGRFDLSGVHNLVHLRRTPDTKATDCRALDLTARHRREFADCREELVELWDALFDFDAHRITTKSGARVAGFEQVLDSFDHGLGDEYRIRIVYRLAHLVYQSPFENLSKILGAHGLLSGLEMWRNIARGWGGVCSEKAWALKFACDVLGVANTPVYGAGHDVPADLESRLVRLVAEDDPEALDVWLQHHLLELDLAGRRVLVDVANGNMPFLFLAGRDAKTRIRCGLRARMVYHTEKLSLARASSLAGDIMLVHSRQRIPGLSYQFVFEQGLGLRIGDRLFLGVFLDWHEEQSRRKQDYYSSCARRLGLPYPRFVHARTLASVPDEAFRELLRGALEALREGYPRQEYNGDFTFVIQPLAPHRWSRPQVSPEVLDMLAAGG